MSQDAAAVASREDAGDQLEVTVAKDLLHFCQPRQIFGRLEVNGVQAGGEQDAIEAVLRRRLGDPPDIVHVLIRAQTPRDIDPAEGQRVFGRPDRTGQEQAGDGELSHGEADYTADYAS